MKTTLVLCVAMLALELGCQNSSRTKPTQGPESVAGISLGFQDLGEDESGIPRSVLVLAENGGAIALDTVRVSLAKIERERYAEMGIPTEALDACGGWYAGSGDYFYVVQRKGKAIVYKGFQDEAQTDQGYHWQELEME
jgi:hypothetical protein